MFKKYRTKKILNRITKLFDDISKFDILDYKQLLLKYEEVEHLFDTVNIDIPEHHILELKISKAYALEKCERISEAKKLLTNVLIQDPTNVRALNSLGNLAISSKEYKEGIKRFESSIELEPINPYAYYSRGICNGHLGAFKLAINDLRISMTQDPNSPETYHDLALFLKINKQYKKALEICNQSLARFKGDGDIYLIAGECHLGLNEKKLACNKFTLAKAFENQKACYLLKIYCN